MRAGKFSFPVIRKTTPNYPLIQRSLTGNREGEQFSISFRDLEINSFVTSILHARNMNGILRKITDSSTSHFLEW
jgi:hypothetical protein